MAEFEWDDGNLREITNHRVTTEEAEEAFSDPRRMVRAGTVRDREWRGLLIGATRTGRILSVVYTRRGGAIRIITAFRASPRVQRAYEGW